MEDQHWMTLTDAEKALMHSQREPSASAVFTTMPTNRTCCADASACPCPCPLAHADVAANSTSLAIIEQRAPRQRFWESFPLECAAAQVCWGDPSFPRPRWTKDRGDRRRVDFVAVKGMNPAPHIHEHLRYTIMATALRTPSRITTSRLSTLR